AKSPATPKTLVIPRSLSLDRTWSITVGDVAFCVGVDSCNIPLVDTASFVGADARDILWSPKILVFHVGDVLFLSKSRTTSRGFSFLGNRFTLSLHRLHEVSGRRSFERQSITNFSHDALLQRINEVHACVAARHLRHL